MITDYKISCNLLKLLKDNIILLHKLLMNTEAYYSSMTYLVIQEKELKRIMTNPSEWKVLSLDEQKQINQKLRGIEDLINDRECGNSCITDCDFTGTIQEIIEHEKDCIGLRECVEVKKPKKTKYISNQTAKCDICGKVYYHTSNHLKPQSALTRHLKSCEKTIGRRLRGQIRNKLDTFNDEDLKKLLQFIDNL